MAKRIEKTPAGNQKSAQPQHVVEKEFAFTKENYLYFGASFGIVILGFILMSGTEDIFSFRKIGLSVIVLLFGYIFCIYAIMKRPKA